MMLAFRFVSAILHARETGRGQVVDCAKIDGAALLMSMVWSMLAGGAWVDERGVNLIDTGASFYDICQTTDGENVLIGLIEAQFFALLKQRAGLDATFDAQKDREQWLAQKVALAAIFVAGRARNGAH